MFALAYSSQAAAPFEFTALRELGATSAIKNARLGITGFLNYDAESESFFQFLEGERGVVEALMATIERDPRHRVLNVVPILESERLAAIAKTSSKEFHQLQSERQAQASTEGETRFFPCWQMKILSKKDFKAVGLEDQLVEVLRAMKQPTHQGARAARVVRLANQLARRSVVILSDSDVPHLAADA